VSKTVKNRILVVDDEASIRESMEMLLTAEGYEVRTATNGFDALLQLRIELSDLIVSDLNMPQMSGFELLSVIRRRYPEIPVIAVSGAYASSNGVPGGVIADAFYAKGQHHPQDLLRTVAELIRSTADRSRDPQRQSAPVWIPINGSDAGRLPFIVLTCMNCLRSFPLSILKESLQEIQETPCIFCNSCVRYIVDFSVEVCSPAKAYAAGATLPD
jgi:CheY-like chemotaxis protein